MDRPTATLLTIDPIMDIRKLGAGVQVVFCSFAVLVFVMLGANDVAAQEARSFEQLQVLVKPGDAVTITDTRGGITKGKITDLSNSRLRLLGKNGARDFSQSEVIEIRQRRADSLANGAIAGAIGVGIDALVRPRQTIFRGRSSPASISFTPLLSSNRRGVQFALRF
jgi:hypothetical protein